MIKDGTWSYYGTVVRVVDGDTVELDLDLGFKIRMRGSFRLLGLNARESHEAGGKQAKAHLAELLPVGTEITAGSVKVDKYGGRYDAVLWVGVNNGGDPPRHSAGDAGSLNDHLIAARWAAPWDGTGPRTLPPWPREP